MTAARRGAALTLLVAAISGLLVPPWHAVGQPEASPAVRALSADLAALVDPSSAIWGISVQSLDRDETLFALNPRVRLDPASAIKLVTLAAAADRLGWNYRYETDLLVAGPAAEGRVPGDLIVRGSGDPTINAPDTDGQVFETWAAELRAAGIEQIDGRIVGDDRAFADDIWTGWGPGWGWDDLAFGFAAPTGALQHRANIVVLTIQPGGRAGAPVSLDIDPTSGLELLNLAETGASGAERTLTLRRLPGPANLVVGGTIPAGATPLTREVAVDNPTRFFVRALRRQLIAAGITVSGDAVDIDDLPDQEQRDRQDEGRVLVRHRSAPLSEIAVVMMKDSQNLYAETLLRTVAFAVGTPAGTEASQAVADTLRSWALDEGQYRIADGSGLSPHNLVSSETLVGVLRQMHDDPEHREVFSRTLPIAGRDGTLTARLRDTAAAGNASAKTGTKTGVRALAGYVNTRDGERVAFALVANHFAEPGLTVTRTIDRVVARLADFTRGPDR